MVKNEKVIKMERGKEGNEGTKRGTDEGKDADGEGEYN